MDNSDSMFSLALLALLGVGAYLWWRSQVTPLPYGVDSMTAHAPGQASPPSLSPVRKVENLVNVAGVPIGAVGTAAQQAPTWAKLAFFPVGVTALTQNIIDNPGAATSQIANATWSGTKTVANAAGTVIAAPVKFLANLF